LEEGFSDAFVIKESVDNGWVKVLQLAEDEEKLENCGACPRNSLRRGSGNNTGPQKQTLLLIDESGGRTFCRSNGP
jgi:hypothetical protein